jgi:hypothetical protein
MEPVAVHVGRFGGGTRGGSNQNVFGESQMKKISMFAVAMILFVGGNVAGQMPTPADKDGFVIVHQQGSFSVTVSYDSGQKKEAKYSGGKTTVIGKGDGNFSEATRAVVEMDQHSKKFMSSTMRKVASTPLVVPPQVRYVQVAVPVRYPAVPITVVPAVWYRYPGYNYCFWGQGSRGWGYWYHDGVQWVHTVSLP